MKEITLTAEKREDRGKEASHKYRSNGMIPGVIYGPETDPMKVAIKNNELTGLIRREGRSNMLLDLNVEGESIPRKVIIRELQRDPVKGDFKHVDLYQVSLKRKLNMMIGVHLIGVPIGVKNSGGILQQVRREIEIACLPTDIPNTIEFDVSHMDIGDSVHVSDLTLENIDILAEEKLTIATVVPPTVIKVATAAEGEEGEEGEAGEAEAEKGEAKDDKSEDKG